MCHPAWGPARSPAPVPEGRREGVPAVDQQRLWDAEAAHDGARPLPLDVAALAACSGSRGEEMPCASVIAPDFSAGP
ncbi:hypothetical protein [Sinomonas atrocyanea]